MIARVNHRPAAFFQPIGTIVRSALEASPSTRPFAGRVRGFHLNAAGPIKIGDRYETRNQIPSADREIYNADGIGVILD